MAKTSPASTCKGTAELNPGHVTRQTDYQRPSTAGPWDQPEDRTRHGWAGACTLFIDQAGDSAAHLDSGPTANQIAQALALHSTLDTDKNWLGVEAVAFKIESNEWPPGRKVDIKIEIFANSTSAGKVVLDEKKLVLNGERNDEGFLELEKSHTFDGDSHKGYSHARATFVVYDESNGASDPITKDSLFVRRST